MKNTLRFEYAWLLKEPKARTTKSKSRIERTEDLMKDVDEVTNRNKRAQADIKFVALQGGTQKLIELKNITKSYGDRTVLKNVDLLVTAKSRIGLLGKNGSGKSTLIKVLLGHEGVDSGEVKRADHLKVIYFSQERDKFSPNETPRTVLCPQGDYVQFGGKFVHVNGYLERFLLGGDMAITPLRKLSGGEQNRLHLARLMLGEGNLLVLDEPTNDLDLETLHVLEEALEEFSGGLILVTHDRLFLNRLSNEILYVNDAGLERFADVLQWEDYYLERKQKLLNRRGDRAGSTVTVNVDVQNVSTSFEVPSPDSVAVASSPDVKGARTKQKLSYKFVRELETMEENIAKAESELAEFSKKLETSSELSAKEISELSQKVAAAQERVDRLFARWDELLKMQVSD
jgi:ATP-binding cassette subfamily F protein uup